MDILLKNVNIVDSRYEAEKERQDILIRNGRIEAIGAGLKAKGIAAKDFNGACVSIGWLDVGVQTGDPGYEYREDLQSVGRAAAAGGFTGIACQPNNNPCTDNKGAVLYLTRHTSADLVDFFPIGALTAQCQGKEITEMIDMQRAGAIAFSDGKRPVQHAGILLRALQYVKTFDGVVINQPLDDTLAHGGQMHEGLTSTSLGMKGIPALAETLMVQRDIYLTAYADSKLHIAGVSTAEAVDLIRSAKARGLKVTASVAALNLAFTDEALQSFDSNLKVLPPLRLASDQEALKTGLQDGTLDLIFSNHIPLEEEAKKLEFPYASFGVLGLQTTYSVANNYSGLDTETLVERFAYRSREILGLEVPKLAKGELANITIFDPEASWNLEEHAILSKSKNTPFLGHSLKGKVIGVINNGQTYFNE